MQEIKYLRTETDIIKNKIGLNDNNNISVIRFLAESEEEPDEDKVDEENGLNDRKGKGKKGMRGKKGPKHGNKRKGMNRLEGGSKELDNESGKSRNLQVADVLDPSVFETIHKRYRERGRKDRRGRKRGIRGGNKRETVYKIESNSVESSGEERNELSSQRNLKEEDDTESKQNACMMYLCSKFIYIW